MQEKSGIVRVLPWLPTIFGVGALLAFTVVTIVRLLPGHSTPQTLPPPEPPIALPGTTSGPQAPVSLIPSGPAGNSASPASAPTSPDPRPTRTIPAMISPSRTTKPPARPVVVTGQFHVLDSYDDSFIGEVLLVNRTSVEQNWVLVLSYPGNLRTSWLESLPQPTLVQSGHTFTWTSSVPLAAGSSGQMRFHFDRAGGSDNADSCTVNGSPCG